MEKKEHEKDTINFQVVDYNNKKFYYFVLLVVVVLIGYSSYRLIDIRTHVNSVSECQNYLKSYDEEGIKFFCCYYCKKNYKVLGDYIDNKGCYCNDVIHKEFDNEYFGEVVHRGIEKVENDKLKIVNISKKE